MPELAEELLDELARARLASGDAVPADSVQMGSTLTYEVDGGAPAGDAGLSGGGRHRRRARLGGAPIGTALLGLVGGRVVVDEKLGRARGGFAIRG